MSSFSIYQKVNCSDNGITTTLVNFLDLIICFEIFIICLQFLASLLVIEVTPHSNDNCLEIFIFGEMVIIFADGLMAEINRAVLPVTENPNDSFHFYVVGDVFNCKSDCFNRFIINFSLTFK